MQTSIATTLALVCHANATPRGLSGAGPDLRHATLRSVTHISCITRRGDAWICGARNVGELCGIDSPHDYLGRLRAASVRFEYSTKGKRHPWETVGAVGGG